MQGAAAGLFFFFEHDYTLSRLGQPHGCGHTGRTRADDQRVAGIVNRRVTGDRSRRLFRVINRAQGASLNTGAALDAELHVDTGLFAVKVWSANGTGPITVRTCTAVWLDR